MTAQMVQDVLMFERKKMKWINGGRNRARTCDPLIKSQLLLPGDWSNIRASTRPAIRDCDIM